MAEKVQAVQELEDRFIRATRSRRAVIEAVVSQDGLFSAEDLCKALPHVGRATVYRTLSYLQDSGVVCRVVVDGGALRYRLGSARHHHHLVCVGCGAVQDMAGCGVDAFVESIAARFGYEPVDHRLEVYGRCAACRGAAA